MSKDDQNKRPEPILPGKPQSAEGNKPTPKETERVATELPTSVRPTNALKQEPIMTYQPNEQVQTGGGSLSVIEANNEEMKRYLAEIKRINATIIPGVTIEPDTERAFGNAQTIMYNLVLKVLRVKSLQDFKKQWLAIVIFVRKNKDVLNETSLFTGLNTWLNRKDQFNAYVRAMTLIQTTSAMENPMMVRTVIQLGTIEQSLKRVLPTVDVAMRLAHVYG